MRLFGCWGYSRTGIVTRTCSPPALAVLDSNATLSLKTTFSTAEPVTQSAYYFPLNSDVALYGLRATINDGALSRVIVGKVLQKEAARKAFATAVEEDRPAALLEVISRKLMLMLISMVAISRLPRDDCSAPSLPRTSTSSSSGHSPREARSSSRSPGHRLSARTPPPRAPCGSSSPRHCCTATRRR